ncbi:competence protein ComGF [Salinicoccus roseus]|jgi:competence protein ComGF|uniref:ComGF family competence protein n=1 Tax=Salinicoccus roseus TaxID=45670 RepID=UPI000F5129C2|nr:competence protein ComGF [Salinicoccus roseus]
MKSGVPILNEPGGFTYIEALVSLSIAAFVMALMPSILMQFDAVQSPKKGFEMDFFIFEITEVHEGSTAVAADGENEVITFKTAKGDISYRKYGSRIVKSVEGSGFVTVMFEVEQFNLRETDTHVVLTVASGEGENSEALLFTK